MFSSKANAYCKVFLFIAALFLAAGISHAGITVNLVSPASNYATNTTGAVSFTFNFITDEDVTGACNLTVNGTVANATVAPLANATNFTLTSASFPSDGSYTWGVTCVQLGAPGTVNTSASRYIIIDRTAPAITGNFGTDADIYYSYYDSDNGMLHFNATFTEGDSGIQFVQADLTNLTGNVSLSINMTNTSNAGTIWNGTINASEIIKTYPFSQAEPIMGFNVRFYVYDRAGNAPQFGSSYVLAVLFHNLGGFQAPPAQFASCVQPGSGTTNLSYVPNFNAVNLVQVTSLNGSAECMLNMTGVNHEAPWGPNFQTVGVFNFTSVNMSNQAQATAVMGAMGGSIRMQIAPPHSFQPSRIYVNSTAISALNTSAQINLYNLPFAWQPEVVADNGSGITNVTWSQGAYDSTYGTKVGNLTISVGSFSGYNVTDNVAPTASVVLPSANTTSGIVPISIIANGTGTEINTLSINITSGGTVYNYASYSNITNTSNCTVSNIGDANVSCRITVTLPNGTYSMNVSVLDFGGTAGNFYSTVSTFTVDTTAPTVTLSSPGNNTNLTSRNATFTWVATEMLLPNITCNFMIDGATNRSNIVVTNSTAYTTFATTLFPLGPHNWSVSCWDNLSNNGTSPTYYFRVNNVTDGQTGANITGTYSGLVAYINGTNNSATWENNYSGSVLQVNITTSAGLPLLLFNYNFSTWLNFSNLNITQGSSGGAGYVVVQGANSTGGQSGTKTVYFYNVGTDFTGVCIKESATADNSSFSAACDGANEYAVLCPGTNGTYVCNKTGTTLTVSGLTHSAVKQFSPPAAASGTNSGSSSSTGGGYATGSGSSASSPTTVSAEYSVEVGGGKFCIVSVKREIASGTSLSVMTVTLENKGGEGCSMADFVFRDTIPENFSAVNEITFSPAYTTREGWAVVFNFPSFGSGESKALTYSVSKWVPGSRVSSFGAALLSAKKGEAAPTPAPTPQPGTGTGTGTTPSAPGSDRDAWGCIPSAGYSWCEALKKCVRSWEEKCEAAAPAPAPPAPAAGSDLFGSFLGMGAILFGILVAVVVVYFLMKRHKKRGLEKI